MAAFTSSAKVRAMVNRSSRIGLLRVFLWEWVRSSLSVQRRVQVEIVRHHCRTEDADGDVQHSRVTNNLRRGDEEPFRDSEQTRPGKQDFQSEAAPITPMSEITRASTKRNPFVVRTESGERPARSGTRPKAAVCEQQVQRDGRPDHLREITSGDAISAPIQSMNETGRL